MKDKIKRTRSVQVRLTQEEYDFLEQKFRLSEIQHRGYAGIVTACPQYFQQCESDSGSCEQYRQGLP